MTITLEELTLGALAREASQPIIEFEGRWITWGEMRHVAQRMGSFLDASGAPPGAPVALVARNRPSSVAALLGLIATSHSIRMVHEDGFLFHRGRADGAIIRGGFKLLPETIERALLLHPSVSAAAVVGVPDTRLGQVPVAAIQLKPGVAPPTVADLEAHLRAHVLATHIPVKWRLVEDLPRNRSMKTDRPAVRRLFEMP
jgi:acyl-coenzyme A synthetase/AMP-(fatty) acid ligase